MIGKLTLAVFLTAVFILCAQAQGIERFPPPEFEGSHQIPQTTIPPGRSQIYEYTDVGVLFLSLSLASYLVLKKRSRAWIFAMMIFSLGYFGFWRKGCVCPVGSLQNVALAVFDGSYAIPVTAILFFFLPLVFTLFFGRTFCAAVCPLGAVQDIVVIKPINVPGWLESALRLAAWLYLGLAVLFAATGSAFIICRYDPFVSLFRLSGSLPVLIIGGSFLLAGIFVARPYCRFLCPYGIILRQLSRFSRYHATITPDDCIKCRLCEDSCPFGAIIKPTAPWDRKDYAKSRKRFIGLLLLLPVLTAASGWVGSSANHITSRVHPTVRLAERISLEETGRADGTTDASSAFRDSGGSVRSLYDDAGRIRGQFELGGWFFGGLLGLAAGVKLLNHSVRWQRTDYQPDRAGCLSCGRCFAYCPKELSRRRKVSDKKCNSQDSAIAAKNKEN